MRFYIYKSLCLFFTLTQRKNSKTKLMYILFKFETNFYWFQFSEVCEDFFKASIDLV